MIRIALVGRPNVGKSTLFNKLTRSRKALVDNTPGLTRDRQYGMVTRRTALGLLHFQIIDTGGVESETGDTVGLMINKQAQKAIEEADGILFLTDGAQGLSSEDRVIAEKLRHSNKPVICAVNKTEKGSDLNAANTFFELGGFDIVPISARYGHGINKALEELFSKGNLLSINQSRQKSEQKTPSPEKEEALSVCVIGCPNVGKSSLINRILGEDRLVVSEISGTTRDTIDLQIKSPDGNHFLFTDTAGIRRKKQSKRRVEKYSIMAAFKAMNRAQVAIFVFDAQRGVTDQDIRVALYAYDKGCGAVIAVNKWDLIQKERKHAAKQFLEDFHLRFPQLAHIPMLFVSAQTGRQINRILPMVSRVGKTLHERIATPELNRWLQETIGRHPPPRLPHNRQLKIRYLTQAEGTPPTFIFFANHPAKIAASYQRYLESQLRENFDFKGVPIHLIFKKGENPYAERKSTKKSRHRAKKALPRGQRKKRHNSAQRRRKKSCAISCKV
ncbi:ribosome biogenesis GTPase Der [Magnetococcales bacterium HHB-1]